MILDASAIVAVVTEEPAAERIEETIATFPDAAAGTPTLLEAGVVLVRQVGPVGRELLLRFVQEAAIVPIRFEDQHWREALLAHVRFGKGQHPARLNFGDCLVYAVAKLANEPLLTLDPGFAHTDLELV